MVTESPPASDPWLGETLATLGGGAAAEPADGVSDVDGEADVDAGGVNVGETLNEASTCGKGSKRSATTWTGRCSCPARERLVL